MNLPSLKSLIKENQLNKTLRVYHGTGKKFKKFNFKTSLQKIIWFTSNKEAIISGTVGASGKGYILTLDISLKSPAGWKEYDNLTLDELQQRGYDGAILPNKDGSYDGFVFEPSQVKIVGAEEVK